MTARDRWLIRVFDGRSSVHLGGTSDLDGARKRADSIATRARRQGRNVSVTVRPLLDMSTTIDAALESMDERGVYSTSSFGGRADRDEAVSSNG